MTCKTGSSIWLWASLILVLALSGCNALSIDKSIASGGHDSRVRLVILHYTSVDFDQSIYLLTQTGVSSHYLIGDQPAKIYQLVPEHRRAWHAGDSSWHGRTWLNSSSIGIELVYPGYLLMNGQQYWPQWSEQQIDLLVRLLKDIVARHELPKDSIVGHADVSPQRKIDPGPMFPWSSLANAGLISWPKPEHMELFQPIYAQQLPDAHWFQQKLQLLGYQIEPSGVIDEQTQNVLKVVWMKYGSHDLQAMSMAQLAAIIQSLVVQQVHN